MHRFALSPLFAGVLLSLLLWLGRRLPRWLRVLAGCGVGACCLLCTQLGADPLLHFVEARAAAPCAAPLPQAVVVLAGGAAEDARPGDYAALNLFSLRRAIGGVRLWQRQPPGTPLVFSGGTVFDGATEASLMAAFAEQLGVPADAIRVEAHSRTTWENARKLAAMQPPVPHRVWLVTSASHMPRALYSLRQAGFDACPAPVDYRAMPPHSWRALMPTAEAIAKSDTALHELVGLLWYHLKGS